MLHSASADTHPSLLTGAPWTMARGSRESLKVFALGLMVLDHVNKYLYAESITFIFHAGRVVMPIFGFVLAYNLAQPGARDRGVHRRIVVRLGILGLIATPVVMAMNARIGVNPTWFPLNILFTLLLFVLIAYRLEQPGIKNASLAISGLILGGIFVEYLWPGLLCCLAAWAFCRKTSLFRLCLWFTATFSLGLVSRNDTWGVLAIPIVLYASRVVSSVPRMKWSFYVFYPVHLAIILGVQRAWY